jgi:hypothetical protein
VAVVGVEAEDIEGEAEVEIEVVTEVVVTCVITVTKTDITQKTAQNHQRNENLECRMDDALFVTKRVIRK